MKFLMRARLALVLLMLWPASSQALDKWQELPEPAPMPAAVTSGKAPVNGILMYYAVYGTSGSPILMIHGGLGYADVFSSQVADLMKDHVVIVADSRGHRRSTRTADPYSYELMASDYLALLDYLKVDKVNLVGWSDGGIIGLIIAINHPERLIKLFANAANATTDGLIPTVMDNKTFGAYIERCGKVYEKISPTPTQYNAFLEQIGAMWATQPHLTTDDLKKITTPTEIVVGEHDEGIKPEHSKYLADTIPGAKLVILRGLSHFSMLQDPPVYTKAIRDFID